MKNRYLIVGNWKMNPDTPEEAKKLVQTIRRTAVGLKHVRTVMCPPFIFAGLFSEKNHSANIAWGAQSASIEETSAHTGEVSATMLKEMGLEYVIVGHSETRQNIDGGTGDTDLAVAKRLHNVLDAGLCPIVCVGERVRDEAGSQFEYVRNQLTKSLSGVSQDEAKKIVIAYEPVWAIGAKAAMMPEQVCEMTLFVKKTFADMYGNDHGLNVTVLYGGSVNAANASEIVSVGQVDGLLVGRESVSVEGFPALLKAVDQIK